MVTLSLQVRIIHVQLEWCLIVQDQAVNLQTNGPLSNINLDLSQSNHSSGRWFTAINYTVHGIMYSYYALRATGRRTPGFIPKFITTVQILQMVAGKNKMELFYQVCHDIFRYIYIVQKK